MFYLFYLRDSTLFTTLDWPLQPNIRYLKLCSVHRYIQVMGFKNCISLYEDGLQIVIEKIYIAFKLK